MSAATLSPAASVLPRELAKLRAADRPAFLRELLAHVAAGILVIEGDQAAAEAVYRLADAVVSKGSR